MELLPGVHAVPNRWATVYLLTDAASGSGITIIDAGFGPFDQVILNYLVAIGRRPEDVQRILLTHRHIDHVGGAKGLRDATAAPVFAHEHDAAQIAGQVPARGARSFRQVVERSLLPLVLPYAPCPVDHLLTGGQTLDIGHLGDMQVVYTPGHTLGHCSLLLPARKLLILGDALVHPAEGPHVPRAIFNDDDALAHRTSIALAGIEADVLAFAHGRPILEDGKRYLQDAARRSDAYLSRARRR
jgi:glyoxylase-like metal-dependent hydrolase (beta-lactamase superfamily II)